MKNKESLCISTFMLLLFLINSASGQKEVLTLLNRPDFNGGLAVHLGTTNGVLESVLAAGDKYLVHGLSPDESWCNVARRLLRKEGIYGLASLVVWPDRSQLPYASNLVNVLIADTDALGPESPEKKELMRVLAPADTRIFSPLL